MMESDAVKFPKHYSLMDGKFEVRHLVEDRLRSLKHSEFKPLNPLIYSNYADAIEYLMRFHNKGGVLDLKKAQHVIQFMIDAYEREYEPSIEDDSAYQRAMARSNFDQVSSEYYEALHEYRKPLEKEPFRDERGPF